MSSSAILRYGVLTILIMPKWPRSQRANHLWHEWFTVRSEKTYRSQSMTTTIVRATCPHDCPDTCAMLVTVQDGVATEVRGDPAHPSTNGALCTKVSRYVERTYHKDRLLYPRKRVGKKGEGKF